MERVTGIWLDFDKAYIYHIQKRKNEFLIIDSEIEHYHLVGGSRSSTPYGPQDAVSERHFLERRKHQIKSYFNRIVPCLTESMQVVVMGPAEAKVCLYQHLDGLNNTKFKLHPVMTKDNMTENQVRATIRNFYKNLPR